MNNLFAFGGGPYDWLIIAGVVFLLFGNRLPQAMRNLGRGVTEFKKGVSGLEDESTEEEDANLPKPKKPEATKQE